MVDVEKYLKKDIDKKTEKSIKAFADSIVMNRQREAFRLLFATDLHYKSDNVLCFGTMKKLKEMVMCAALIKPDLFVLNGDLTDGHSGKRIITAELSELFDNLKVLDIPIIINQGNHDCASWFAYENKSAEFIKPDEWNALISKVTNRNERGYGYIDFDKSRLRTVYLNTSDIINKTDEYGCITDAEHCQQWCLGMGEDQITWLEKTISECPHDYSLIYFSHYIPCGDKVINGERVWEIIKRYNKRNRVLAYMYGHKHRDSHDNTDGISCICTQDMMNARVMADDGKEYCATLKDIPVICDEPVFNNPKAQITGGWDYIEITKQSFRSRRFLNEQFNREIMII